MDEVTIKNYKGRLYIGNELRVIREECGLTIQDLAEKSGVKPTTICHIELGKFNLKIDTLQKLTEAMGKEIKFI